MDTAGQSRCFGSLPFELSGAPLTGAPRWTMLAGNNTTCGVAADGSLWCWHANHYGQDGRGEHGSAAPLEIVAP